MLKKMICERTTILLLIAVTIVAVIPASQTAAEEVFYDNAQVISTKPLYATRTVPITSEQCDFEDSDANAQSESSSAKGLVDAIRDSVKGQDTAQRQPQCQTITLFESQEEIVAYKVRYEYGREIYERRMDRDPGEFVRVRVRLDPRP